MVMANGLPIDLETFETLPEKQQNVAIFKTLIYMMSSGFEPEQDRENRRRSCEKRFKALEKRRNIDRGLSAGTGFIGGFVAAIAKGLGLGS
jgi:hypothetical protein